MTSSGRSSLRPSAGQALRGRDRRVAAREGCAQPRLRGLNELGHSYVGPEHFLIGLAEEGEGLAANLLRRYGLTPQALRQQVSKVVGKGAEDGRAETPTNTPELDKYSRDLTKMARDGKLDPVIGARRDRNHHRGAGPAQEEQPGADRRAGCGQDRHRRRAGAAHGGG
ncbi:Clp protease N-terminal domain-containing protein [Klebsiella variicola]|uniref:Clp protease N-terminal domain-containing protein n=1 Tax=Klebsiella variicola TaxID=244366 RepID=UPI00388FD080